MRILVCFLLMLMTSGAIWAGAHEPEFNCVRDIFAADEEIGKQCSRVGQLLSDNSITLAQARERWGALRDQAVGLRLDAPRRLYRAWASESPARSRRLTEFTNDLHALLDLQVQRLQGLDDAAGIEAAQGSAAAEKAWERQRATLKRYQELQSALKQRLEKKYSTPP